ncbi:hypothetical protein D3C81_1294160 [compost metagenome]
MPAALVAQVRRAPDQQHEHPGQQVGDRAQPADQQGIVEAQVLDDRRQPEVDRVNPALDTEVDETEGPDQRVGEHRQYAVAGGRRFAGGIGLEVGLDHLPFSRAQPLGFGVAVTEQENCQKAEQYGGQALDQEHPLPAGQAMLAGGEVIENPARERPAEQAGHRDRRHEQGHDPPAPGRREPARKVQHDAGEEARFGGAGEQAQHVELHGRGDEQQAGRQRAPGDHHQRDPAPRAEAVERQVAGQPAEHIADEENPGTQAVDGFAELERIEHLQLGEADVDPVQVVEQVADEDEWNQPQGNAPIQRIAGGVLALVRGRAV